MVFAISSPISAQRKPISPELANHVIVYLLHTWLLFLRLTFYLLNYDCFSLSSPVLKIQVSHGEKWTVSGKILIKYVIMLILKWWTYILTNQSVALLCWNSAYRFTVYINELYRCTPQNEYNIYVIPYVIYSNMVNVLILWGGEKLFILWIDESISILRKYNFRIVITNFWPMNYDGFKPSHLLSL